MRHIGLSILLCLALSASAYGDTIALWNFNDAASDTTGEALFLVDRGSGTMTSDFNPANIGNAAGSTVNSQDGDPAGRALLLGGEANNGKNLTWMASTAGFDSIDVSFAIARTSTGFAENRFLYTFDSGISWTDFAGFAPESSFAIQSFDLGGITGLIDNPNAGFRVVFAGATSYSGNNKIDNLLVSGKPYVPPIDPTPVPEPSTIALTACGIACIFVARFRLPRAAPEGKLKPVI